MRTTIAAALLALAACQTVSRMVPDSQGGIWIVDDTVSSSQIIARGVISCQRDAAGVPTCQRAREASATPPRPKSQQGETCATDADCVAGLRCMSHPMAASSCE